MTVSKVIHVYGQFTNLNFVMDCMKIHYAFYPNQIARLCSTIFLAINDHDLSKSQLFYRKIVSYTKGMTHFILTYFIQN
ncbi:hypothetical protein BpHYR1_035520 [Brachionus plicatilis]|uniref:Uncharacterized protein n=1 Tax=Brachionus plicatilis TaxID=10195 RepID=A0A3M7SD10_BRAPC|nr:hypothetical protein BpHYR1_035520 [Brachionus plicatilis]